MRNNSTHRQNKPVGHNSNDNRGFNPRRFNNHNNLFQARHSNNSPQQNHNNPFQPRNFNNPFSQQKFNNYRPQNNYTPTPMSISTRNTLLIIIANNENRSSPQNPRNQTPHHHYIHFQNVGNSRPDRIFGEITNIEQDITTKLKIFTSQPYPKI